MENYHKFVDDELLKKDLVIREITQSYMQLKLEQIMVFVNNIRKEHSNLYGWQPESKEYFLRELDKKWDFSFSIEKIINGEIIFIALTSVYDQALHLHCAYASREYRNLQLAKLHMIKSCQKGLDLGFRKHEGYWPKNNNGSIMLYLKMGFQIVDVCKNGQQLFMIADNEYVRNKSIKLYLSENYR